MIVLWHIQRLAGYVDGKPSWLKVASCLRESIATERMEQMRATKPMAKFRIRKVTRRGRRR